MKSLYYILDSNGYITSYASGYVLVNGVGSVELPTPENFDEAYFFCYHKVNDSWAFNSDMKAEYVAKEMAANNKLTIEQRTTALEEAVLSLMLENMGGMF